MSAGDTLPCTDQEFNKIRNALLKSQSGVQAELHCGTVYLYADDGCNWEDVPQVVFKTIGKLLKKANQKYLECGMAYTSDKICAESQGGGYVRILQDGTLVEPKLVWPKEAK